MLKRNHLIERHAEKGFSQKDQLKTHLGIHTEEKPFVCEVCNKGFSQKSDLKKHLYIHIEEKPFICKTCKKRIFQKKSFKYTPKYLY